MLSKSMQSAKMAVLLWSIVALTRSLRSGFKTYLATGSSWQTASQIISAWWSCIWVSPTGSMHSQMPVLIHRLCSGLDFWFLRDSLSILKIVRIKSISIVRETATRISKIKISLNLQMIRLRLKVSREREEGWSLRQNLAWKISLRNFQLNRVKQPSTPKRLLKREILRS